jgi:hypothetical protein
MPQVEIDGQVLGKGIGSTWDEAKMQVCIVSYSESSFVGPKFIFFY